MAWIIGLTTPEERAVLAERGFDLEPDAELTGRLLAALGPMDSEEEEAARAVSEEMTVYWCDADVVALLTCS